jgi:tetratricopeptide (TPR) repeat protein
LSYFKSIVLIFALVFINPLNSAPKKTSFELGYDLYEKKSFEEAKVQFNKSLKESEVLKTYALYYLASIEFELGAHSTSENLLKSIFNSKPVPSEELKNRSLFLYSKIQENKKDGNTHPITPKCFTT